MKIWYDTEFIEDGKSISLISIGLVDENGRELYRITDDEDVITAAVHHPWLRDNVVPSLPVILEDPTSQHPDWDWDGGHDDYLAAVATRRTIADDVRKFITTTPDPELWAWYGAYDHVALAWLFGPMAQLPVGIPMWTNDLRQEYHRLGLDPEQPAQPSGVHNALADARHNRARAEWLAEKNRWFVA